MPRIVRWIGKFVLVVIGAQVGLGQGELISSAGSGRATAYLESTKIITYADKTHVAWLDSDAEGFRVRIRTRDAVSGAWSPVWTIGEAANNHGGPALTVDRDGYLHVVYYAHHNPVRYRRSVRPNDASAWGPIETFGENLTYPALVAMEDGSLIFAARRSHDDRPWEVELWRRSPDDGWKMMGPVVRSRFPGYAQFAASLAIGPKGTLHMATRIFETRDGDTQMPITTVGYLVSEDAGLTWRKANGENVGLPVTAETIDRIASAEATMGRVLSGGSMAVDAAGLPHLVYSERVQASSHGYIATPGDGIAWRHVELNPFLPEAARGYSLHFYGGLSFSSSGALMLVGTLMDIGPEDLAWGDPSMEVVVFAEDKEGILAGRLLRPADASVPRWLPNIERVTGFNEVSGWPAIVYMEGERGAGLDDQLSNRVWWFDLDTEGGLTSPQ